jgi:hypothetical protein
MTPVGLTKVELLLVLMIEHFCVNVPEGSNRPHFTRLCARLHQLVRRGIIISLCGLCWLCGVW